MALPPEKKDAVKTTFGFTQPSSGEVGTQVGSFAFQAMPLALLYQAGVLDDCLETLPYQRATPEKAFLDWLYLGSTSRSHMTLPPLDQDFKRLSQARLTRLAKEMPLDAALAAWKADKAVFGRAPGTRFNAPS